MVAQPSEVGVEEYFEILRSGEARYEYHDGRLIGKAGGTLDHSSVKHNAISAINAGLGDGPCRAYDSDAAVQLSPTRYRLPDASVTCDEHDRGRATKVTVPRVVVEVLSDSTEQTDRYLKFKLYRECASIQEYVLIATRYQGMEVYRRAVPEWTTEIYGPDDVVELESIAVRFPVSLLYERTDVPKILGSADSAASDTPEAADCDLP